jgi:Secretion system C-terminal sorting domain/Nidogen-like
MMKFYFALIIFILSVTIYGQTTKPEVISIERYAELKSKGLLNPKLNYAIGGSEAQQLQNEKKIQQIISNNTRKNQFSRISTVDTCSCLQALDTTFSVVPITFFGFGTPPDYRNDDGSSALIPLPFSFVFFGVTYNACYINNNGNITFSNPDPTFSPNGFPANSAKPMIAPFWADVDTRNALSGIVKFKVTPHYMVVSWDTVGYFNAQANKRNTFQVIISDGTDSIIKGSGNVAFCYGDMQWTTGDASNGVNGFGGFAATVGFDKGDNIKFAQIGRFDSTGLAYDGSIGANDGVDFLDRQSFYFNVSDTNNFQPVSVNNDSNCFFVSNSKLGDTSFVSFKFIGPEIGQNVVLSANLPAAVPGFFVKSSQNGPLAKMVIGIVNTGTNLGLHNFSVSATDNGVPSKSSVVNYTASLDTNSTSSITKHFAIKNQAVSIYPNPSSGLFNIKTSMETYTIEIFDVFGRTIFIEKNKKAIDVSALKNGTYLLQLKDQKTGVQIVKRIVHQQ